MVCSHPRRDWDGNFERSLRGRSGNEGGHPAFASVSVVMEKISNITFQVAKPISFFLILAIVLIFLMEMFFRWFPLVSLDWSEELGQMLAVTLACVAASAALKQGFHIGFTYFLTKIKNTRVLALLDLIVQVFVLGFLVSVLVISGFHYAIKVSYQTAPGTHVSMFWPHLSIPIGFLMMSVHCLYFLVKDLQMLRKPEPA